MKKENRTIDYSMANYIRSIVDQSGISAREVGGVVRCYAQNDCILLLR